MDFFRTFDREVTGFSPSAIRALNALGFQEPNDCESVRIRIILDSTDFKPFGFDDEVSTYGIESCQTEICPVLTLKQGVKVRQGDRLFLLNRLSYIAGAWGAVGLRTGLDDLSGCSRLVVLCKQVKRLS